MLTIKIFTTSILTLVGCVYASPAILEPNGKLDPQPSNDIASRPGCVNQSDCWSWALDQCEHAKDSGLLIKTYCLDQFCYALCPPRIPDNAFSSISSRTALESKPSEKNHINPSSEIPYPLPTILPPGVSTTSITQTKKTRTTRSRHHSPPSPSKTRSTKMPSTTSSNNKYLTSPYPLPTFTLLPEPDSSATSG